MATGKYKLEKNAQHVPAENFLDKVYNNCKLELRATRLATFDFDYTIIAKNSDTVIRDLLPRDKIPSELDVQTIGWTQYMSAIFQLLRQNDIMPEKILQTVRQIPEVPGMIHLIKTLHDRHNFDIVIISDANSVFIEEWIKSHDLVNAVSHIYTNPAKFDSDGLLHLQPYHHQTDCKMSAMNLCKGLVLEKYVEDAKNHQHKRFQNIVYTGDGPNDICPATRLREYDVACARSGFGMERGLERKRAKNHFKASSISWKTGFDLLVQLETCFKLPRTDCSAYMSYHLNRVQSDM